MTSNENRLDALFLCENARIFAVIGGRAALLQSDHGLYFLAISIELSLKAYLRNAGMTDDDTKWRVRHNLFEATRFAALLGLDLSNATHDFVIGSIGNRYASGGFRRPPSVEWPKPFVSTVSSHAINLNRRVTRCLAG